MIRVNSVLNIFIEKKFERILTNSKFFVNKFMFFPEGCPYSTSNLTGGNDKIYAKSLQRL